MNNVIAFEKWATSDNRNLDVSISPVNNGYKSLATLLAWEAWQAAIEQSTALLNTCLAFAKQEQAQAVPYGWHVTGLSCLMVGEYAEHDAKAAAKRCGGTTKAIPLYTAPPAIDDETKQSAIELCRTILACDLTGSELKAKELLKKLEAGND